jgi:hypothetical protein
MASGKELPILFKGKPRRSSAHEPFDRSRTAKQRQDNPTGHKQSSRWFWCLVAMVPVAVSFR